MPARFGDSAHIAFAAQKTPLIVADVLRRDRKMPVVPPEI
jgi:hypothetical protein